MNKVFYIFLFSLVLIFFLFTYKYYSSQKNIDAKVHYPIPIHLQKAAKFLKHKKGDFPIAERLANTSVSLPVHEFVSTSQVKYIARSIS